MKADPSAQLKLLDVQELDARLDQLHHRLASLPETAEVERLRTERQQVDNQARDAQIEVDDLTREQKRADADVEQVKGRRERDRQRMDSGQVTNPKDLERMQHEMVSLERRISDLEDVEIDVMERLEAAQATLDDRRRRVGMLDDELTAATVKRDEKAGGLRDDAARVEQERVAAVTGMPEDLIALYEKLRAQKGGVGAAALRARQCGGCRLTLNAADLGTIAKAPEDDVLRCEECNRILVRIAESGL